MRAPGLSALLSLETLDVVFGESKTVGPTNRHKNTETTREYLNSLVVRRS